MKNLIPPTSSAEPYILPLIKFINGIIPHNVGMTINHFARFHNKINAQINDHMPKTENTYVISQTLKNCDATHNNAQHIKKYIKSRTFIINQLKNNTNIWIK